MPASLKALDFGVMLILSARSTQLVDHHHLVLSFRFFESLKIQTKLSGAKMKLEVS